MRTVLWLCVLACITASVVGWDGTDYEEGQGWDGTDYEENVMLRNTSLEYYEEAVKYAPLLKFHKTEGDEGFCYPHNAGEYYDARVSGDSSRQCNERYETLIHVPTYWHAEKCGMSLHIAYWSFYGYNHNCDCCSGERDAWWEFIVVKVGEHGTAFEQVSAVMFGQKHGWYTRHPGHYEVFDHTHPVAYVGRASHGNYHDHGGSNTCCYWEDTRNPGDTGKHMETWRNLSWLTETGNEGWMADPSLDVWNGLENPVFRLDYHLCALMGCDGANVMLCDKSGCARSDVGDNEPF